MVPIKGTCSREAACLHTQNICPEVVNNMIYKIKSSQVPGLMGRIEDRWIEIIDHTALLQPGLGGYENVKLGDPIKGNHMFSNTETITYDQQGRSVPNFCSHTATAKPNYGSLDELCSAKKGYVPFWDYALNPTASGWRASIIRDYNIRWMPNFTGGFVDGWLETVGSELDDSAVLARAIANVRSGILKPVFNLPRAILELKDTAQTLRGILQMMQFLKGATTLVANFAASGRNGEIAGKPFNPNVRMHGRQFTSDRWSALQNVISATKGSLNDVAAAYLTYQFGIRPTVGDVRKFLGLKWKRGQQGRTTELWFEARHLQYKAGQKLRVPYSLGGRAALPSLPVFRDWKRIGLLRDFHSACWPTSDGTFKRWLELNAKPVRAETISGLVFAEVAADKRVDVPYSELINYSGGFFSTIYEVTPWTWCVDSVYDVGQWLQTFERMSFPTEYRPVLKHGTWKSVARSNDVYVPIFDDVGVDASIAIPCDPFSGFAGEALVKAHIGRPRWHAALKGAMSYIREPVSGFTELLENAPPLTLPGRYMLGPVAALIAQSATGSKHGRVRASGLPSS